MDAFERHVDLTVNLTLGEEDMVKHGGASVVTLKEGQRGKSNHTNCRVVEAFDGLIPVMLMQGGMTVKP